MHKGAEQRVTQATPRATCRMVGRRRAGRGTCRDLARVGSHRNTTEARAENHPDPSRGNFRFPFDLPLRLAKTMDNR